MRTTLDLDDSVLAALRERGALERKSLGRLASELLARALADPAPATREFTWVARDLGGTKVDLEDKEAVRRVLDRD
ncbi:antitoxin [Svornostia abyssi]|uniref:Antitoxin n=1 Tax=Svornostia abyssi TaxID=2898438 RepID=A0ABY5PND1_9ACTN|nr:antitoxin [Parviterribacteraceae bacterium J379]